MHVHYGQVNLTSSTLRDYVFIIPSFLLAGPASLSVDSRHAMQSVGLPISYLQNVKFGLHFQVCVPTSGQVSGSLPYPALPSHIAVALFSVSGLKDKQNVDKSKRRLH